MRRAQLIGTIVGVILIGWLLVYFLAFPEEPAWQGRSLSQWLSARYSACARDGFSPEVVRADAAFCRAMLGMGTNTVPILLDLLAASDTESRARMLRFVNSQQMIGHRMAGADEKHRWALQGFWVLREQAHNAAPRLVELTDNKDPDTRRMAYLSLQAVGVDRDALKSVLMKWVNDPQPEFRDRAVAALVSLDPAAAEQAGIRRRAAFTISELFPDLADTNQPSSLSPVPSAGPTNFFETPPLQYGPQR